MSKNTEQASGGEMGHHGRDRQPAKDGIRTIKAEAPDEKEAAKPSEVQERSKSAATKRTHASPDAIRPEPKTESPPSE